MKLVYSCFLAVSSVYRKLVYYFWKVMEIEKAMRRPWTASPLSKPPCGYCLAARAIALTRAGWLAEARALLESQGTPARYRLEIQLDALGAALNSDRVGVIRTEEQSRAHTLAVVSAPLPPRHPESGPLLRPWPGRRQEGRRQGRRAGGH